MRPEYPLASVRAKESGVTQVQVSVKENGEVTQVTTGASSGYPRLDGAAREGIRLCQFLPARDPEGFAVPGVASVRHVWRLEDAAPDPWVALRAANGKAHWAVTEDLGSVAFSSPSETNPEQRVKILRRLREAASENAACGSIEGVTSNPPPPDWKIAPVTDPKTGREIRIVRELWDTVQCGVSMNYVLVMRFPDGETPTFVMIPLAPKDVPRDATKRAAPAGRVITYSDRIAAAIRPKIIFVAGESNPVAELELKVAPDGRITGSRLSKGSGDPAWDQAVLTAIARTPRLPVDDNGKAPPTVVLSLRPR